jgi:entericidin A
MYERFDNRGTGGSEAVGWAPPLSSASFNWNQGDYKMKKLFALVIAAYVLAGCNTVEGLGKDVKKAGEVVENAAKK